MRSVHNTPIEGLWHWFRQTFGQNIKDTIHSGFQRGIYKPNNPLHPYVLYSCLVLIKVESIYQKIVLLVMAQNSAETT